MPAFQIALAGIPLHIAAEAAQLTDLLAQYFRYYGPQAQAAADLLDCSAGIHLSLSLCETLPARETLLSPAAELLSQSGELQLWCEPAQEAAADRFYFDAGAASFHLDIKAGRLTGYVRPAALTQPRILANTYTLFPLLLMLRARGVYHLHAAAALSPTGKLCLFPASSRAGKTTLTTALGLAGWRPLADDSVLLTLDEAGVRLTPLRKEFHVDERLLTAWPGLAAAAVSHRYYGRACVEALELFNTRALAEQSFTRVNAFILPQITDGEPSRLAPLAPSAVLLKLAEQSMFLQLWRAHTERQFGALSTLVQQAACYQFHSGPEILRDPHLAAAALRSLD
jgi:hypothetical protein